MILSIPSRPIKASKKLGNVNKRKIENSNKSINKTRKLENPLPMFNALAAWDYIDVDANEEEIKKFFDCVKEHKKILMKKAVDEAKMREEQAKHLSYSVCNIRFFQKPDTREVEKILIEKSVIRW